MRAPAAAVTPGTARTRSSSSRTNATRRSRGTRRRSYFALDDEDVVSRKARVEREEVAQASDEEQRAHEEDEREGHLRNDERASDRQTRTGPRDAAASGLERLERVRLRGLHGGEKPEEHAGEHGEAGGECEQAQVARHLDEETGVLRAQERHEQAAQDLRERGAAGRPGGGEDEALREELTDEPPA